MEYTSKEWEGPGGALFIGEIKLHNFIKPTTTERNRKTKRSEKYS